MLVMLLITAIMNRLDMIHGWWLVLLIITWICVTIKTVAIDD